MAGKPGRSGGARAGAGRPKKPPAPKPPAPPAGDTPLDFLMGLMNDLKQDPKLRFRAAVAAAQYVHDKRHDGGKKPRQAEAAKKASTGRFGAGVPPKLVSSR